MKHSQITFLTIAQKHVFQDFFPLVFERYINSIKLLTGAVQGNCRRGGTRVAALSGNKQLEDQRLFTSLSPRSFQL